MTRQEWAQYLSAQKPRSRTGPRDYVLVSCDRELLVDLREVLPKGAHEAPVIERLINEHLDAAAPKPRSAIERLKRAKRKTGTKTSGALLIDETGNRYGRLLVVGRSGQSAIGRALWDCRCDCGAMSTVLGFNLRAGKTRSCGCLRNRRPARQLIQDPRPFDLQEDIREEFLALSWASVQRYTQ